MRQKEILPGMVSLVTVLHGKRDACCLKQGQFSRSPDGGAGARAYDAHARTNTPLQRQSATESQKQLLVLVW
jgi:hypothetical protein